MLVTILAAVVGCCLSSTSAAAAPAERYEPLPARRWSQEEILALPDGQRRMERELFRQGEYSRRWNLVHDLLGGRHLSRKSRDLLAARGLGRSLLDKAGGGGAQAWGSEASQLDTLRVLVIRIGFETNRDPHLTTIDPSGDFALDPLVNPKPLEVDPPPRNKAFFESHLLGLSEYYRAMSGGRLHIEGRVLPEGENDSYKLADVADYGPGAGNFWTLEKLELLVQDMMRKADQETQRDGSVNLAEYDDGSPFTYIIFVHAGSDWQSDVNGDSPNDIPTFFVTLGEPIDLLGTNAQGQPGRLSECSIIPETTSQDDYPGSIAAAFYHEFGHALGLPDVYSTYSGLPSVGIWDLMDSGTNLPVAMGTVVAPGDTFVIYPTGVLPPSISAWNKWFLGWLEVGELDGREDDYRLPAVGLPTGNFPTLPQAYRAGLSGREWFLLENRWVPLSTQETRYDDLRFERDPDTGVILYLAGQRLGSWENSELYDYFMPAGGLLVWHVNSDRIEAGLDDNTINIYNDGLKLVEADGIQDIGVLEAYVQGWYGSYLDPFGGWDPDGFPTGFTNLFVEGFPSSRNFDRSWSGLSLSEIRPASSVSARIMNFKATQGSVPGGFPFEMTPVSQDEAPGAGGLPGPRGIDPASLTPVTLWDGTQQVLVFADAAPDGWSGGDYPASLYCRWGDGSRKWTGLPGKPDAFLDLGAPLSGSPFLHDRTGGGTDLVWGTEAGRVGMTYLSEFGQPTATWPPLRVGARLSGGPAPLPWRTDSLRILCPVSPDTLVLVDATGSLLGQPLKISAPGAAPVTGLVIGTPLPGPGGSGLAPVFSEAGWFLVGQDDNGLAAPPVFTAYGRAAAGIPRWNAVVSVRGAVQVHAFDADGELGAWRVEPDGSIADVGPVLGVDKPLVAAPAVADVDGDGSDDLILCTAEFIYGLRPDGGALRGFPVRFYDLFPLPDSTRVCGPVVVADATGDGVNEIYFNTDGGHLVGLDAAGNLLPRTPLRWGDRRTGGMAVGGPDDGRLLWLVSPGGYTGPPLDRQSVNGRVIAWTLPDAADGSARTSEWLGAAGGAHRRGPDRAARNLGPAAPVAAERDRVVFYPNPVTGPEVTVRFFSAGSRPARVSIYNIEGEEVTRAEIPVTAGAMNDYVLPLPGIASGLYVARLEYEAGSGVVIRTLTLAVEK